MITDVPAENGRAFELLLLRCRNIIYIFFNFDSACGSGARVTSL